MQQYYRDGFRPGDPTIHPAAPGRALGRPQPDEVDVLIVGSGPAGVMLAAQLSQFPEITTRIVERREGRLQLGQADGIACRTVETFEAFGLAGKLIDEAYWVNEVSFWRPGEDDRGAIVRTGRVQDVEDGLSEFPHVIVNQARIQDYLLDFAEHSPTRLQPDYGLEFVSLEVDRDAEYPVAATFARVGGEDTADPADGAEPETVTIRAKYLVGTDGARSRVRAAIGRSLHGDAAGHAWGVMDILPVTDFPDIRLKAAIQSADEGSILLIPREGGNLVRLYVDLGSVDESNRAAVRGLTQEQIAETARRVLHPYTLEVRETAWWSIYEVAQRVTDGFDDTAGRGGANGEGADPRVFIAGDACHTHSAKAGQGMNVSMQDTFNLGWKLIAVLRGQADASLLETYSGERQPVAQDLIDFDREWSAMMAAPPKDPDHPEQGGVDPDELQAYFVKAGRYTAGFGVRYTPSLLTGGAEHQALAAGLEIGRRFHSAPVTRIADAQRVELGHVHRADGRFRAYLFAGRDETPFDDLCAWLETSPDSPIVKLGGDVDSVIDVRGIVQRPHREVDLGSLPSLLRPRTGRYGLVDYEKAFSSITRDGDYYDTRGVDRERGAVVIVRPDMYVAQVLPLDATDEIAGYFAGIFTRAG